MSDLPTFGAEEGFLLVDARTGEPAAHNVAVAAAAKRRGVDLQLELTSRRWRFASPTYRQRLRRPCCSPP